MSTASPSNPHSLAANAAMIALGTCGAYITVMLAAIVPQWIAAGVADDTANYIVSSEKAGMMVSSLALTAVINKWNRRHMAVVFLAALTVTNALTAGVVDPMSLGALRFLCGVSEGGVISLMTAAAVGAGTAARTFGFYLAATLLLSYVGFQSFGALLGAGGLPTVFRAMAGVSVVVALLMPLFPSNTEAGAGSTRGSAGKTAWNYLWLALLATALFEACIMAVWNNMVNTATGAGFAPDSVAFGMNNGLFAGIAGGLAASLMADRFGRSRALVLGVGAMIVSLLVVIALPGKVPFIVVSLLFMFSWMFALPYFVGAVAALDTTGKSATLSIGFQTGGLMLGPLISGAILGSTSNDYALLPYLGIALLIGCIALIVPAVSMKAVKGMST